MSPITAADLKWYLTGAASDGGAQANPNASLGNYRSSSEVGAGANNLFDDVTAAESEAGDTEYRGIFFKNTHATLNLAEPVLWISTDTGNAQDDISFGKEAPDNPNTGKIQTIANEGVAPAGVTFSDATSKATGVAMNLVGAGCVSGIWIRRIISAGASAVTDSVTFTIEGVTPP